MLNSGLLYRSAANRHTRVLPPGCARSLQGVTTDGPFACHSIPGFSRAPGVRTRAQTAMLTREVGMRADMAPGLHAAQHDAKATTKIGSLMRWGKRTPNPEEFGRAPEELVPGQSAMDLAERIRTRLTYASEWGRNSRQAWRRNASLTRILTLGMSAFATIALGLGDLEGWARAGFIASALVTTTSVIEPFFNWRARWVMADEAIARWYTIEDQLLTYVAATPHAELDLEHLQTFDASRQEVWDRFSSQWMSERRRAASEVSPR